MTKKILHVIDSLELIGGAELLLVNTIKLLPDFEHRIIVTTGSGSSFDSIIQELITAINFKKGPFSIGKIKRLKKLIDEFSPDIIHSHLFKSTIITRMALKMMRSSAKFYSSRHSMYSKDVFENSLFNKFIETTTYSKKEHVVGVSNTVLSDYFSEIPKKGESSVLYNHIDNVYFKKENKANINASQSLPVKAVTVGNIKQLKNHELLIKVFSSLDPENFKIDIYGRGAYQSHLESKYKITPNIRFMGSSTEIPKILKNYSLFILPSLHEGYGIAAVEAMAVGLPIMASNLDVLKEICGENIYYFNPLIEEELKQLLLDFNQTKLAINQAALIQRANEIGNQANYISSLLKIYKL